MKLALKSKNAKRTRPLRLNLFIIILGVLGTVLSTLLAATVMLNLHQQVSSSSNDKSRNASEINIDSDNAAGTISNQSSPSALSSNLIRVNSADNVFADLLSEAQEIMKQNPSTVLHSMEVGMHSANQCLLQAANGLQAHCVEPSPSSFGRILKRFEIALEGSRKRVKFYQMAASDQSGVDLKFMSAGGTGDHVGGGGVDAWTMTKTESNGNMDEQNTVTVKSVAIDDIIYNKIQPSINYGQQQNGVATAASIERLYLLKVDVQGHEPSVFSGLQESIRENKIDMIMTEYWPKGIDFMNDSMGPGNECQKPVGILQSLLDAGYTLYGLKAIAHPKAPRDGAIDVMRKYNRGWGHLPFGSLMEHCMWFYDLERKYRDGDGKLSSGEDQIYQMGYWTDVLAVRPGLKLPGVTNTGKRLGM